MDLMLLYSILVGAVITVWLWFVIRMYKKLNE